MSRHEIEARDPAHRVIAGWDPMQATYFAQVIDRAIEREGETDERDKFVLWVGTRWREIGTLDALAGHLRPYAELTNLMRARLYRDKEDDS